MNKRVKELAEQAGLEPTSGCWLFTPGIDVDISKSVANMSYSAELEKFAELIVKETMQVVANNLPANTYLNVADAVIKHFGDKE
jgi:hypothetical protein